MFELGQYASNILISYAVGLVAISTIIGLSIGEQKKVRARIRVLDDQQKRDITER